MDLKRELSITNGSIVLADIGAADFGIPELHSVLFDGTTTRYSFDANPSARNALKASTENVVLPYALGDGRRHTLRILEGGMTSLLEPDPDYWKFYTMFAQKPFWPISPEIVEIETVRLDDVSELPPIDFLKIDTQGSELMIFANGKKKLANCSIIQTEVAFVPTYKDQPLFADVDAELRSQGFMAHGFASMKRLPIMPYSKNGSGSGINQVIDLDMIYMRNMARLDTVTDDQLRKTGFIAHSCYGSYDLTLRCLVEMEGRKLCEPPLAKRYFETLNPSRRVAIAKFPATQG
jgi:FkbM family methyltransferase